MTIHKEGTRIIIFFFILLCILDILFYFLFEKWQVVYYILWSASAIFIILVISFFRKPARHFQPDDKLVYAPADGKVVVIEEVPETEYLNEKRLQISIFMSPLNVHINWLPVSGKILYYQYHPGKYLVAWHPKSSTENERNTIVIQHKAGTLVLVRQIAGIMARRIISYTAEGKHMKQGEELGFIRFGSRVDVFLPTGTKINVNIGQKVKGRKTVLAEI